MLTSRPSCGTVGAILAIGLSLGAPFGGQAITAPIASFLGSASVMSLMYSVTQFNQELRNAFLWLMGSFSDATMGSIAVVAPVLLVASFLLFLQAKHYNATATGDETALQLGTDMQKTKRLSYLLASLITGVVVSVSDLVGFVGPIISHICRMIFGPDHRLLHPASFLLGASFVLVAELLSRSLVSPAEISVGAVTAAIGAPLFISLLRKH